DGLLAALGLVAGFKIDGGTQAQRVCGGLWQYLRQPEDPGQLHRGLLAPLRRPAILRGIREDPVIGAAWRTGEGGGSAARLCPWAKKLAHGKGTEPNPA